MREVHAGYGATPILFGVSLEVREGEAVALLGKNGMGKTTLMKTAIGFLKPWRGAIEFEGRDLTRLAPHDIARLGVGLVPENRRIFPGLTVRENLELGLSAAPQRSGALRETRLAAVFQHFPRLRERLEQPGKTLSGGEQQMLAIARVMMAGARLTPLERSRTAASPSSRFSRTVRPGKMRRFSGTRPTPRHAISCGRRPISECPSNSMVPRHGRRKPMAVFISVVLPIPFLPSSATASPARTSSDTPKRIGVAP